MYPTLPFVVLQLLGCMYVGRFLTESIPTIPPNERALPTINRFPLRGSRVRCHISVLPVNFATPIPHHYLRQIDNTLKSEPTKMQQIALLSCTLRRILQNVLGPGVVAVQNLMPTAREHWLEELL